MLKPETGYSTQETQKCASRTRLNSSFRRAILERAVSALRAIQADSPDEPKPEGCAARPVIHQSPDEPRERIQVHAQSFLRGSGAMAVTIGMIVLLSAQSKGDFRPRLP